MEPLVVIVFVVGGFFLMFANKETVSMMPVVGLALVLLFAALYGALSLLPSHVNPYKDYTVKVERKDVDPAEVGRGTVVAILTGPRGTVDYYRKPNEHH